MKSIMNRIKGLFKIARLISTEEGEDFLRGVVSYMGTQGPAQVLVPYGTMLNPPVDAQMMVLAQGGLQSNAIGIASDPKNRTLKDLEPGEYAVGNYTSGSYMVFRNNGDVELNVEGAFIVNVEGETTITSVDTMLLTTGGSTNIDLEAGNATRINSPLNMRSFDIRNINSNINYSDHQHPQENDGNNDAEEDTGGPLTS